MNKFIFTLAIVFYSTLLLCQTSTPTVGLTGYWPFNNNANDLSVNGNNGIVYGASLTTDRFGNQNNAYSFNGINSYIETPINGLLTNEYSYSVWALTNTLPPSGTGSFIFYSGSYGATQCINTNNNVGVNNGLGGNGYNTSSPIQYITYQGTNVITSQWAHIVLTRSSRAMKLYINCKLIKTDSTTYNTFPAYGASATVKFGARENNTAFFDGKIDDIRVYNRAISNTEVCALFNESNPTTGIKTYEMSNNLFSIFPVPISNYLFLNYNPLKEIGNKVDITIFSSNGQLLKAIHLDKNELQSIHKIDLEDLVAGIYSLQITSGDYYQNLKFVKE